MKKELQWRVKVKRGDKVLIACTINGMETYEEFIKYWRGKGCETFTVPIIPNRKNGGDTNDN